jgi:5-formyltetrahydrofolate cyclo-ligase
MNGTSPILTKKELRLLIKERKNQLSTDECIRFSNLIMYKIEQCEAFRTAQSVLCYWSLSDEVRTIDFIDKHWQSKKIYLPVVVGDSFELHLFEGKEKMKKGAFGIAEPLGEICKEDVDVAIVPGVAFDKKGHRLGRGKGFYDRFLSGTNAYKIGIAFRCQLVNDMPVDAWDIIMDEVLTE